MNKQNENPTAFWEHKELSQMTHDEWESLCDGCGRCCLHKLQDEEDGTIYYTDAACDLLDLNSCRCSDYPNRQEKMADCIQLSVDHTEHFNWLPASCAYRLLAEGEPLPIWHPLITGDTNSVVEAGISVHGIAKSNCDIDKLIPEIISFADFR